MLPLPEDSNSTLLSADSLAPFLWLDYMVAYHMQRDTISSTLKESFAEDYDWYEERALPALSCVQGEPCFGCPPASSTALKRFGLASFLDPVMFPLQVLEYQSIPIPTS